MKWLKVPIYTRHVLHARAWSCFIIAKQQADDHYQQLLLKWGKLLYQPMQSIKWKQFLHERKVSSRIALLPSTRIEVTSHEGKRKS